MAARKTTRKSAPSTDVVEVDAPAKSELKQKFADAIEKAKESSREQMLAGLGFVSQLRQQRQDRTAELVEEGKRVEPEIKQAFEDLKAKFQRKDGDKSRFDLKARLDEGMTNALHRIGLATRKDVESLSKKVDRLIEAQDA